MTVFTEVVAAVLAALLRGGKIARLAVLDLRAMPLLFLTVALRFLADWLATYWLPAAVWLQPVAYLALGWFFILNIRRAGFLLLGAGSALNLLVMLFNGGAMPVSPAALETIGAAGTVPQGTHTLLSGTTRLPFLADVIPLRWHFPVPVVISAGDILITLGVFLFIQHQMLAPHTGSSASRLLPGQAGEAPLQKNRWRSQ